MTELSGLTRIIAHIGYPTTTFKAPMIYNPYFNSIGLDVAVVPMGVRREDGMAAVPAILRMTNVIGALITMPLKVDVVPLLDEASAAVRIAGSCNALRRDGEGRLIGDMFDGEGFARGVERKGFEIAGRRVLVVGAGGVGSAIAAALAARTPAELMLFDVEPSTVDALAARIRAQYPALAVSSGTNDPSGFDLVVNATPLGMKPGDPLPFDVNRLAKGAFVGEVVLAREKTALLEAAEARGCHIQVGLDMLYEMIPAYLEFFGLPVTTPDELRRLARIPQQGQAR